LRWTAQAGLLNCTRQWGKSTTAAARGVHHLAYFPAPTVAILSPGGRQSAELALKLTQFVARVPSLVLDRHDADLGYFYTNGSRLVPLVGSEATVRGLGAVTLLIVDEAARVAEAMRRAVSPFLAVRNGRVLEMSTPFGKRGFFYRHALDPFFAKMVVPASQCARISAEFLAGELRDLGELWYRQEYGCEFLDLDQSYFGGALLDASLTSDVAPLFGPEALAVAGPEARWHGRWAARLDGAHARG
jgi:hypothetical protein